MPKILPTSTIAVFSNLNDYQDFLKSFYPMYSYNSRRSHCDICKSSGHKMKVQYHKCNNPLCCQDGPCPKRYLTYTCLLSENVKLSKRQLLEINDAEHISDKFEEKQQRGLTQTLKDLIEELISEYECKPKKIHIKLSGSKYFDRVDVMPELDKIQSYIR